MGNENDKTRLVSIRLYEHEIESLERIGGITAGIRKLITQYGDSTSDEDRALSATEEKLISAEKRITSLKPGKFGFTEKEIEKMKEELKIAQDKFKKETKNTILKLLKSS